MKKNIYLLYAISFLQGMVFYGPVATLYRQARGVGLFEIGLIESVSLGLCLLLEIPWGMLADRIGHRRTMVVCCGLYALSKVLFWQARGFAGFLAERVMLSVVLAGMSGVDSSLLYNACKDTDSCRVFGIYDGLGMAGLLTASGVFSLLVKQDDSLAALLTVGSYTLAFLLALGLEEDSPVPVRQRPCLKAALGELGRNWPLLLFVLGAALWNEAHQYITVFLSQVCYARQGMGSAGMGWAYAAASVLAMAGPWSAGLCRRLGMPRCLGLLGCAGAVACLVLALVPGVWAAVVGVLTLRLAFALLTPLQTQVQHQQVRSENRATALSVNAMVMETVGAGANLAFGALAQRGLPLALAFGGGLCLLGAALTMLGQKKLVETREKLCYNTQIPPTEIEEGSALR